MTKEEFIEKKRELEKEYKAKISSLHKEYAFAHSPVKVGDIVENHCDIIQVGNINHTVNFGNNIPVCTYSGPKLKKNLEPFKSGERSTAWQPDVRKINGKDYKYKRI